jgi:hypothetical protein
LGVLSARAMFRSLLNLIPGGWSLPPRPSFFLGLDGAIAWFKVFSLLFILDTRTIARVPKLFVSHLVTVQSHENQSAQHDLRANFSPWAIVKPVQYTNYTPLMGLTKTY